jgi:3-oxoacyl-[acyl-carrier-protein] synthase-3
MNKRAVIRSVGHAVPTRIYTNEELAKEKNIDTSDEWIVQRTGIKQRHICTGDEGAHSLAIGAGREALEKSGLNPSEIEMVIVGTVSGDFIWPSTACFVQDALGLKNAGAFDVSAACAGFIYSLANATALIETGVVKNALVIGVDALSKQIDWTDRSTCILFGDAAASVIVSGVEGGERGVIKTVMLSDGGGAPFINIDLGGTKYPPNCIAPDGLKYGIQMKGNEVYRFAIKAMGDACEKVLAEAGIDASDVDLFVPHQANLRIIDSAAERFKFPNEKVFKNVHKYGNTSGGSIPLALYEAVETGRLKPGMLVLTVGFGAGLVWGANLIRW